MSTPVEKHFDNIAQKYDYFKERNWYYYKNLKSLYKQLIPKQSSVLEIGCGTGDLISETDASQAVGIDISPEMIKIAQQKHSQIHFEDVTVEDFKTNLEFDYIFLADVIEHLEDIPSTIQSIEKICSKNTKIIFTYANPLWEPILMLLEKLSLKMPEGPHYRIPYYKFKKILANNNLVTIERNWRLLLPADIPFISNPVNSIFYHIPLFQRLGMLEYIIIKKK
ncbi:MAG: Methyltransferase type 12 [Candidatus Moranbacteria bacterium GW2011_GWF2_34_56]|nr:MAG: Methyltransferase type 12 [Candidatus Moranbacteria bacterium GW2011_GWF1_34_10]KKP64339.1 MAG: Methyltransferase type 12 [Candidatus Moranbacteria bacterium GW2011_GWF2_34_56]HBI16903.1 hypothetical protein [Candidatus Moranbacteria bacterium]